MNRTPSRSFRPAMLENLEHRVLLANYVVDTSVDESIANATTSLREAIALANANAGADTITFDASLSGSTTTLGGTALSINEDLTITGLGSGNQTITGNSASRVFGINVDGITVAISGLTLTGGSSTLGGAVLNNGGNLTITGCVINGNDAGIGFGGGIANVAGGVLTIVNTTISGNTGTFGGGISSDNSTTTVTDSAITGNDAPDGIGGGIYSDGGALTLTNSTVSGNTTPYGGGILVSAGTLTMSNSTISGNSSVGGAGLFNNNSTISVTGSTISGNTASGQGAGVFNGSGALTVSNSTIANNTATGVGGGVIVDGGTVTLISTIVSGNVQVATPSDIFGTVTGSSVNNLIGDSATAGGLTDGVSGNLVGVDPLLGALANNGGPTQTHALQAGSPAINAGSNPGSLATDQRGAGFARVRGNAIDIGSYEYSVAPTLATFTALPATAIRGQTVTLTGGGAADADGTIARVDFYRDANNNGTPDAGELVGSDSDAAGGYTFAFVPDENVPIGAVAMLAVAVDNDSLASTVRDASFTLQAIPLIGTFTANPANILRGETVTLTAGSITDEDGTISHVEFYRDADGDGIADAGELIGTDSDGSNGYSMDFVPDNTVPLGLVDFLAVAYDNDSHTSAPSTATISLGILPSIATFGAAPATVTRGQTVTLTAGGVTDGDGTVARVDFYRDANNNGIADAGELVSSDSDGSNGYSAVFIPTGSTAIGQLNFLAIAIDNDGLSSEIHTASATLQAVAPTIESVTPSTASFGAGDAVTLTANNVADTDGTITGVSFYADLDNDGVADAGELLGTDSDGSNGYSLALSAAATAALPQGSLIFLAVATDSDGGFSTPAQAAVNVLFSVRAGAGRVLSGTAADGTNVHYIGTINTSGNPIVYEQGAPWSAVDLVTVTGAPAAISDAAFWTDPKDNLIYAAYPSAAGLILLSRAADGTWTFRNLTTELAAPASPADRLVQFTSVDDIVVVVGFTSGGRLVAFQQTLGVVSGGGPQFSFVDVSGQLDAQSMTTPAFTSMTAFVTGWNTWHLVGIDGGSEIQTVWLDPSLFSEWRSDNLSAQYGAPPVQGQLAVTLTPWGGINLTGLDSSGHLRVTWWVPGNAWLNADLTESTGGATFANGNITGYGTPWGGMNYIGVDGSGQVVGYWWAPDVDQWNAGPFLPSDVPANHLPSGALTSYSSAAGTLNIFGTTTTGDSIRMWWEPGAAAWTVEDLSEIAVRV